MIKESRRRYGVCSEPALKRAVVQLIKERGLKDAAAAMGVHETSASRIALGQQVIEATVAVVAMNLHKLSLYVEEDR